MKRFLILTASLIAFMGCQSVDSNVTDSSEEALGLEFFKAIEFSIKDTSATKGPTPITTLSEFNVSATSGSTGSESSKMANVVFADNNESGVFKSDAVWPSSDPGYHFYASNVAMTHTASGQTVSISSIDKDVVCAYIASPSYKVKNDLVFNHILARVGTVTFKNLSLCTDVKLSMKYSGSGTYNIRTGAWSGVGSQSTKELTTANNDFWIIPGNYQATLTYTDANGTPQSKTLNQDFLAGKVNNISAKLDGSVVVKTEEEYSEPTFTLGTISDVPASGGDSGTPSVTAVGQKKRVKKTLADGTVKYDPDWTAVSSPDYTIQYGKDLSSLSDNCPSYHGDNLGTTEKSRSKLGVIYVRVKIGDKTTDKNLEVYQAANIETLGEMSINSFCYSPKVGAAGGTVSPSVTYELPYEWTSGSKGKYTTDATLAYITVTDNAGATLNASTGVIAWAANSGTERSETERVTVSLKGKSSSTDATSTQEGDAVTSCGTPEVSFSYSPANVGTAGGTANPVVSYRQTVVYASGKTSAITTGASSITYSGSTAGFTLDGSSGVVTVAANEGAARGITVTVSVIVNGKAGTSTATVTQMENKQTGSSEETGIEYRDVVTDDYWVKINGETSSSVDVTAVSGSVTVNVAAGHDHKVQKQKRTGTRTKYTWEVGDPTYSDWSWSGWSNEGSATVTSLSDTPTLSSSDSWLKTDGSYDENKKSSGRFGTITAAVKVGTTTKASATLTVYQIAATFTHALTCTGSPISLTVGDLKIINVTVEYLTYINGNYDSKSNVTLKNTFSIGNPSVATIHPFMSGLYYIGGVAAGSTKLYASYNGISSADNNDSGVDVTVKNPDVITYKLVCTGSSVSMTVGETVNFTPSVKYQKYVNGNYDSESDVTKDASFSAGDNSIATVITSGANYYRTYNSTGVAAGSTKIYATYKDISSKDNDDSGIKVTVTQEGKPADQYDINVE